MCVEDDAVQALEREEFAAFHEAFKYLPVFLGRGQVAAWWLWATMMAWALWSKARR